MSNTTSFSGGTYSMDVVVNTSSVYDDAPGMAQSMTEHIVEQMNTSVNRVCETIFRAAPAGVDGKTHFEQAGRVVINNGASVEYELVLDIELDVPHDILVKMFAVVDEQMRHEVEVHLGDDGGLMHLASLLAGLIGNEGDFADSFALHEESENYEMSELPNLSAGSGFGGYM